MANMVGTSLQPFHKAQLQGLGPRSRKQCSLARVCAAKQAAPLVKICGVTSPEDAHLAAEMGADFIGMIMWPKAKRGVSDEVATKIASAAKALSAQPVGVFVDEDAETIARRCRTCGISIAQLHGDGARSSLPGLPEDLQVIWVMHSTPEGELQTPTPQAMGHSRPADWLLIDGLQGGSGQALDWTKLNIPEGQSSKGWLLAGGLKPENVAQAVNIARPYAVDVSSGVCGPDGLRKDASKVSSFIKAAKGA
eukprot:CAMPEP_0202896520 /NCGR_PEP_ID=MMETSP1392-20130828/5513_1 /ASSEMBLY_ACC=CAM_ASM_000868 /TAXON_ID=225041 /ORGANISM="Chlamydomonas chlamydogama, Strain SAG 11-48b" /LENGTH=250 /DNA_ID=CAMNT_0049581911 /DNA_START=25 /DNA_END=777 /DNA_ORIENTATION=-